MSLHQQPQHQQEQGEAYKNFINSINSSITKLDYDKAFLYFMNYCKKESYDDMLAIGPKIEGVIRDYIIYLRHTRNLSPATIASYICPITHFYEMNDVTIKWKKLNKFKAKYYNITEDRPYTRQQIKTLLDAAPLRDKCIILLMASAGLRRGAIPYLRIKDLQKIDDYGLYKISVYRKEQEQYTTFCTPECAKLIDQYLDWRQRLGEQLKPNSPLLRITFDTVTQINTPKPFTARGISCIIYRLLDSTGVRERQTGERTELMQTHGFRKFFKTTCIQAGMNPLYSEYVMGHRTGLTKSYFKPTDTELLEGNDKALGYIAAINDLTINEENRLAKKLTEREQHIQRIETEQQKAIEILTQKIKELDDILGTK